MFEDDEARAVLAKGKEAAVAIAKLLSDNGEQFSAKGITQEASVLGLMEVVTHAAKLSGCPEGALLGMFMYYFGKAYDLDVRARVSEHGEKNEVGFLGKSIEC